MLVTVGGYANIASDECCLFRAMLHCSQCRIHVAVGNWVWFATPGCISHFCHVFSLAHVRNAGSGEFRKKDEFLAVVRTAAVLKT